MTNTRLLIRMLAAAIICFGIAALAGQSRTAPGQKLFKKNLRGLKQQDLERLADLGKQSRKQASSKQPAATLVKCIAT